MLDLTWRLARPFLFSLDAERAHRLVIAALSRAPRLFAKISRVLADAPAPQLARTVGGLRLAGPIGLAAGLDKDGECVEFWPALGFGFIEVGTVTAHAQPGNPQPRLFRLKAERASINRMGFNNHGSTELAARLGALRKAGRWPRVPVGANIGKSKITPFEDAPKDYVLSVERLRDVADYLTVNVSSPNTPGLRDLQQAEQLRRLLDLVVPAARTTPVFVKLSPDSADEDLADAVEVSIQAGSSGVIAVNTTRSRPGPTGRLGEDGGLSGAPLWPLARERIATAVSAAAGRVPVIGVGGLSDPAQIDELLKLGCAAVQIYTSLIYNGPLQVARLNRALARRRP